MQPEIDMNEEMIEMKVAIDNLAVAEAVITDLRDVFGSISTGDVELTYYGKPVDHEVLMGMIGESYVEIKEQAAAVCDAIAEATEKCLTVIREHVVH